MKVKSEVAQSCPTPSDPMDYSLPGSSAQGICQARVLEWGAIAFSLNGIADTKKKTPQFEQTLAVSEGQGSLAYWSPRCHK